MNKSSTDATYRRLLFQIDEQPVQSSRNGPVKSNPWLPQVLFSETPLITVRKVAWKTAIKEWEWFMSGDDRCPKELLPWWKPQLSPTGRYVGGYGSQLRKIEIGYRSYFDQILMFLDALRNHKDSRRLILTTWNPKDMWCITQMNDNPNTPTTCHTTILQAFVRNKLLYFTSYQRSADMLLGVPHNWIQTWAFLLYCAAHTGLEPGGLRWLFGDAHIYQHPSHLTVLQQFRELPPDHPRLNGSTSTPKLIYTAKPSDADVPEFKTSDFEMSDVPDPLITDRPVLL